MRLLTHNALRNNAADAKGKGYPLKIIADEIRVDDHEEKIHNPEQEIAFMKGILGMIDWSTLVSGAADLGLDSIPAKLTEEMASDDGFLKVLYHILMNVRVVQGKLVCPETARVFTVQDGIPNFMLNEEESENVRI